MREINRRRLAEAKSHRASAADLRAARARIRAIDGELRQIELQPETKRGEERKLRYDRVLRLRAMREAFLAAYPAAEPRHGNSVLLAAVMFAGAFMLCAFCAAIGYASLSLLHQQPDPITSANSYWQVMAQTQYDTVESVYFSPTLRAERPLSVFVGQARQADTAYGPVTGATYVSESGDLKSTAMLVYSVTRGNKIHYTVTLKMELRFNAWVIDDIGASVAPSEAGVPTPTPSATVAATPSATASPTP